MRKSLRWVKASRARKITAGFLSTFLVAGAAFAFYASVLAGGSGSVQTTLGNNNNTPATFTIAADPNNPLPTNLQPGGCPGGTPGSACQPFGLVANNASGGSGVVQSVTLTGIDLPTGCPAGSVLVVWPDGKTSQAEGTYTEPSSLTAGGTSSPLYIAPTSTNTELFPSFAGSVTPNGLPLLFMLDTGVNQDQCAGGTITAHFTATND